MQNPRQVMLTAGEHIRAGRPAEALEVLAGLEVAPHVEQVRLRYLATALHLAGRSAEALPLAERARAITAEAEEPDETGRAAELAGRIREVLGVPQGAITAEMLVYGISVPADPQLSPDGAWIAYTLRGADPVTRLATSEVWLGRRDGSGARRMGPPGVRASGARWSPDGARLAFTQEIGGETGIALADAAGGEVAILLRQPELAGDLEWSPDGRQLAYVVTVDPDGPATGPAPRVRVTRRLDHKEDGRGWRGDARDHLFVADVATGERRQLTKADADHHGPKWSPDGRWIATGPVLIPVDGGEVVRAMKPGQIVSWSWSPDSRQVLYAADLDHALQPDLYLFDLAERSIRRLTSDMDAIPAAGPGGSSTPVWLDPDHVLLHVMRRAASELRLLDVRSGAMETEVRWETRNGGLSVDGSGRYVAQVVQSPEQPGEIAVYDRQDRSLRIVTAQNGAFAGLPKVPFERFTFERDGFEIDAWLQLPPDLDPARRYPLVLEVHGGPTASDGTMFSPLRQYLARNGFLALSVNPRGSNSYGGAFARAVVRDWGVGDYADLMAAVDRVLERPYADPERTGVYGYSYGGYMSAWIVGRTDRFKAAVVGSPMFHLESSYGTSDVHYRGFEHHFGGGPHAEREHYREHSPSTYAPKVCTPTLLIHGEDDLRITVGQSEEMFVALSKAGCDVEFARYPGASHMFFATGYPEHRIDWLRRVLAHYQRYLAGAPETSPTQPARATA